MLIRGAPSAGKRLVAGFGEEYPFAQAGGMAVDQRVDGLKAEVGHPRPVKVRISEADRQGFPPDLPGPALFTGETIQATFFCFQDIFYNFFLFCRLGGGQDICPGIYIASEIRMITLDINSLLIISGILLAVDVALFFVSTATFRREEILTKWK